MRGGLCPAGLEPIYSQGREGGGPGQRTPVLPSSLFSGLAGSWSPAQCREQGHQRNTGASVVSAAWMGGGDTWGGLFTRSPSPQDVIELWWRGREALLRAGKLFCHSCPLSLAAPAQEGRPGQLGVGVGVRKPRHSPVSRAPGGLHALGRAPRRRILSGAWKGLAGMAGPEPSLHTSGLSRVPKLKGDVKPGPAPGVWAA